MQTRAGVRARMAARGCQVIRDHMPEQHRDFFATLPTLLVGALDATGQPWATLLSGAPGFASSPDPRHIDLQATLRPDDPLASALTPGARTGLLGIEFHTRRRNRMNGRIVARESDCLSILVEQSFGNCPKYIAPRRLAFDPDNTAIPTDLTQTSALDRRAQATIAAATTFFIASAYGDDPLDPRHGVDVSHRGGAAGFVECQDERTLRWPDYPGNLFFNTIGNLLLNPRAGLLFVDFDKLSTLQIAGRARIDESDSARTIVFEVEACVYRRRILPLIVSAA